MLRTKISLNLIFKFVRMPSPLLVIFFCAIASQNEAIHGMKSIIQRDSVPAYTSLPSVSALFFPDSKSQHSLNHTSFSLSESIYLSLNQFWPHLTSLASLALFSQHFCLCLTYILWESRATVFSRFNEVVRPRRFAGSDGKAVHRPSIQMDGGLPALPHAPVHRHLFPILWPQELLCCKNQRQQDEMFLCKVNFKKPVAPTYCRRVSCH